MPNSRIVRVRWSRFQKLCTISLLLLCGLTSNSRYMIPGLMLSTMAGMRYGNNSLLCQILMENKMHIRYVTITSNKDVFLCLLAEYCSWALYVPKVWVLDWPQSTLQASWDFLSGTSWQRKVREIILCWWKINRPQAMRRGIRFNINSQVFWICDHISLLLCVCTDMHELAMYFSYIIHNSTYFRVISCQPTFVIK